MIWLGHPFNCSIFNVFKSLALIKWNYLNSSIVNWPAHHIFDSNQMPILLKRKQKKPKSKRNHNRWLLIKSKISGKDQYNKYLKTNSIFYLSSWVEAIEQFIGVFVPSHLQFTIAISCAECGDETHADRCCCCFTMYRNAMYQFVIEITIKHHHVSCCFHISIVIAIDVWIDHIAEVL